MRDRRGWSAVAGAAVVVLLLDALRVFLPSIIFVFGRAGSTPATTMGLFAVGWFAGGFLAIPAARWIGARRLAIGSALALLAARLALLATDGGDPQLYLAGITFVLATWTLVGVAEAAADQWPARGTLVGIPVAVFLHVGLGTVDLQWQDGATGWIISSVLGVALVLGAARLAAREEGAEVDFDPDAPPADAGFWWRLGPALLVVAVVTAAPAWTMRVSDQLLPSSGELLLGRSVLVILAMLGTAAALSWEPTFRGRATAADDSRRRTAGLAAVAAVAVLGGLAATLFGSGVVRTIGPYFVAALLPTLLLLHAGDGSGRRRGVGAATAGLLIGAIGFLHYAGYDMNLGDNRLVLLVARLLLVAWRPAPPMTGPLAIGRRLRPVEELSTVAAAALLLVLLVFAAPRTPTPELATGPIRDVRVAIANIHMGWDTQGRFAIDRIAADLMALDADIIVLNEVDRGWLLTGGHDTLTLLSERLGMPYVFGPAADPVWGNAILSRHPLLSVEVEPLPRGGVPMARSAIAARATLGGRTLVVVGTHLHHVDDDDAVRAEQADAVAGLVRGAVEAEFPTVLLGDLNAVPGDSALAPLTELLDDAIAPADPLFTFPAWDPDERIDHIMASRELVVSDIQRGGGPESSDHLWLAVTLSLP